MRRPGQFAVAAFTALTAQLGAQCPDGSQPPCPRLVAAARHVDPPLDDHTWIVVPFDNLAKAADADWLRGASVNLLYLDMSRWRDIHVIDDERVADLLREIPEAAGAQQLSLNAGIALARRAGAGKLVMGDIVKLGNRTTVTAKVFDVKSAQRVRSVREETTVQDSVLPLFSKLARKVLNVAPPAGANLGALGTTRIDAYQEYIAGVAALNRFDLRVARRQLDQAIKLDPTFALAHYKLSVVISWSSLSDSTERTSAESASRMSASLPARERGLIAGRLQQANGQWTASCVTYGSLVKSDSNDVDALYAMGECLHHDQTIEAIGGDTARLHFRADRNASIRTFDRVLQLDPTYHLAYTHIIDAFVAERQGPLCYRPDASSPCVEYSAFLIRSGDSLVATPARSRQQLDEQAARYLQTKSRARNLALAERYAAAWVQALPEESQAHRYLEHVYLLQGRLTEAGAEAALVKEQPVPVWEKAQYLLDRMDIAIKQGRGREAIRIYDSVRTSNIPAPDVGQLGSGLAILGGTFGRLTETDSGFAEAQRANKMEGLTRFARTGLRATISGRPPENYAIIQDSSFAFLSARWPKTVATRMIAPSLELNLGVPRASWPAIDTSSRDVRLRPVVALIARDTVRLRAAAVSLDSVAGAMVTGGVADTSFSLIAAEAYLVLGDSAAALRSVRFALDRAAATTPYFPLGGSEPPVYWLIARTMLLRADLAAAAHQRDEAAIWYRRFIDLWSTAVPELQPVVEQARKSLAALGAP